MISAARAGFLPARGASLKDAYNGWLQRQQGNPDNIVLVAAAGGGVHVQATGHLEFFLSPRARAPILRQRVLPGGRGLRWRAWLGRVAALMELDDLHCAGNTTPSLASLRRGVPPT